VISTLLYGMRQSGASALLHVAFLIDLRHTVSAICMTPSQKRSLIKGVLSATGDTDVTGDREKFPKARQKE
jgi:hypothetical protein